MRIAVAVATIGRAEIVRRTLPAMLAQTRAPDRVVIAAVKPADVEGVAALDPRVETVFSGKGLPVQRNAALDAIGDDCDLVVFFDDDFVPAPDFLAETEKLFTSRSDIAAASGMLIADGINTAGISADEAYALVADAMTRPIADPRAPWAINHCYGCNMVARLPAAREVRFDERLPLYAWQEDRDFSVRLRRHGLIMRTPLLRGVHMGVKQARSPGVPLGYSQVANPLYLLRKGTMRPLETAALVGRNIAANLLRQFSPEPWVDRAGRVRGNFMALSDALRGRYTPERILDFGKPS